MLKVARAVRHVVESRFGSDKRQKHGASPLIARVASWCLELKTPKLNHPSFKPVTSLPSISMVTEVSSAKKITLVSRLIDVEKFENHCCS